MEQYVLKTWWAKIFVGLQVAYSGRLASYTLIETLCERFCLHNKLCVTVTPTKFVYPGGFEPGAIIGVIQYPRFPQPEGRLRRLALDLGELLRVELNQLRVTVQMEDATILLVKSGISAGLAEEDEITRTDEVLVESDN